MNKQTKQDNDRMLEVSCIGKKALVKFPELTAIKQKVGCCLKDKDKDFCFLFCSEACKAFGGYFKLS